MKAALDGRQASLFKPEASWLPPAVLPDLTRMDIVSLDTETSDPNLKEKGAGWCRNDGYIVGISAAWPEEGKAKAFYAPFRHEGGDNLPPENVIAWLNYFFKNFKGTLILMNGMYDLGWLIATGIDMSRVMNEEIKLWDVMFTEALLDENRRSYNLNSLAETHGFQQKNESLLSEAAYAFGFDSKSGLWRLPARYVGPYAETDAKLPLKIYFKQKKLIEDQSLEKVHGLEHSLVPCLLDMRLRGIRVDLDKAERYRAGFIGKHDEAVLKIKNICGLAPEVFAADSVAKCFDAASITYPKTGKGRPSFTDDWLSSHPSDMAKLVTFARKQHRAANTFCDGLVLNKHHNGRVHCEFHPLRSDEGGTVTGRFSCSNPNLQQTPVHDIDVGNKIRELFLPEEGEMWAASDWCFSDDTEVLTEEGFKLFSILTKEDKLWQYHLNTRELSLATPLNYQKMPYKGYMKSFKGKFIDLLVSPNHNCLLFEDGDIKRPEMHKAEVLPVHDYCQLHAVPVSFGSNEKYLDNLLLILICAIQADASLEVGKRITFKLKKQRKIDRLKRTLEELEMNYKEFKGKSQEGFIYIRFSVQELPRKIHEFLDLSSKAKTFKRSLLHLSLDKRNFLLQELRLWDGSHNYYCSTNIANVHLMQEIATLSGIRTSLSISKTRVGKDFAKVGFSSTEPMTYICRLQRSDILYDGSIYCVTMPESTVIVRRNGKVMITGQSQQEPRLTVHYAEERGCRGAHEAAEAYRSDHRTDYHNLIATLVFGPGFTKDQRKVAKTINLGGAYGMGGAKLCKELGLPTIMKTNFKGQQYEAAGPEGQAIMDRYHAAVPFIRELSDYYKKVATENGTLRTLSGRLYHFCWYEPISGGRALKYEDAVRTYGANNIRMAYTHKALNSKIQGGSGDIMKISMRNLYREGHKILLTMHDENGLSVGTNKRAKEAAEIMNSCVKLRVPLLCDVDVGPSWGEAKALVEEAA